MPHHSNNPEVHPVGTEKSKHIDILVTNQQINSSKKRGSSRQDGRYVRPPRRRLATANPLPVNRQTPQVNNRLTHNLFDGQIHQPVDRHNHQVNWPNNYQDNRQNYHNRQTHNLIDRQPNNPVDSKIYLPIDGQAHHPVGIITDQEASTKFDTAFLRNISWELIKKVAKSKGVSY